MSYPPSRGRCGIAQQTNNRAPYTPAAAASTHRSRTPHRRNHDEIVVLAYAARTVIKNLPTSAFSRSLSCDNSFAADNTYDEAEPVSPAPRCTSVMFEDTCMVPCAACCTVREISCVAAPCSSTAAAMVDEISDMRPMVSPISLIAETEPWIAFWMPAICWLMSPVALAVWSANALTSDATTAKPRPASPAPCRLDAR
jgi:hypothetical protein